MISDVLNMAVEDINYYLDHPTYKDVYTGRLREKLKFLRDDMNSIRLLLDKMPTKKQVTATRKKALAKKSKTRKT